jgi:hypothetical protein
MAYDRSKHMMEKYGLTPEDYARMAMEQGNACKCCGYIPTGTKVNLHIDHCHVIARSKVKYTKRADGVVWAFIERFGELIEGPTRAEAELKAKRWLLRKSVRGLLCWKCNSLLKWARNCAVILRKAAKYLDEFEVSLVK